MEQIRTHLSSESVAAAAGLYAADLGRCLRGHERHGTDTEVRRVETVPRAGLDDTDYEVLRQRVEGAHSRRRLRWLLHIGDSR